MSVEREVVQLRHEVAIQRRLLSRVAAALHKHARTDLAPDAALPELAALVQELDGTAPVHVDMGAVAYNRFCAAKGDACLPWHRLPSKTQDAWREAAQACVEFVAEVA